MHTMSVRISFTNPAAQVIVEEQGMDVLDEIENLCKAIHQPGGVIPGLIPGNPPLNSPGTPINVCAENHLKLLAFYLRHQKRISKVVNVANITHDAIRTLRKLRDYESSYKHRTTHRQSMARIGPKPWKVSRNPPFVPRRTENTPGICCQKG